MPAGFQTFNSAGILQFSSEAIGFGFVTKGTKTFTESYTSFFGGPETYAHTGGSGGGFVNMPVWTDIAAWASDSYYVAIFKTIFNDTIFGTNAGYIASWCTRPSPTGTSSSPASTAANAIEYYVFNRYNRITITENVGLELFNSQGHRTYHSSVKPAIVAHVKPITSAADFGSSVALPAGRKYAFAGVGSVRNTIGLLPAVKRTSTGYSIGEIAAGVDYDGITPYYETEAIYDGSIITFDVTDL